MSHDRNVDHPDDEHRPPARILDLTVSFHPSESRTTETETPSRHSATAAPHAAPVSSLDPESPIPTTEIPPRHAEPLATSVTIPLPEPLDMEQADPGRWLSLQFAAALLELEDDAPPD